MHNRERSLEDTMDKPLEDRQKMRERVTYRYLQALDSGDMNAIAEVLQYAIYDAPLEQMLLDVHREYFQEGPQAHQGVWMGEEAAAPVPLHPLDYERKQPRQRFPWWMRTLVAVLIVGILVGSLATFLTLRQSWLSNPGVLTPTVPACHPYPLRQYGVADGSNVGSQSSLQDVTALSVNDVWAVGSSISVPTAPVISESPFIEHWDGKSWQPVSSPAPGNGNGRLVAVAGVSTHDVWAVGSRFPSNTGNAPSGGRRTLIEHWDGKSWQIVASPDGPTGYGLLNALTVISPEDIWAAGTSEDAYQLLHPLLEHWNGSIWQVVTTAKSDQINSGTFDDIAAISAHDIWVVGRSHYAGEIGTRGLVEHWNGSQWQVVAVPANMVSGASVRAVSTRSVWMTGQNGTSPFMMHWDGRQWTNVVLPASLMSGTVYLSKIVVAADNNVWVAANTQARNGIEEMYLSHWNGKSWQPLKMPLLIAPFQISNSLIAGIAVYGGSQLWIVGSVNDSEEGHTSAFILGQRTCPRA